MHNLLVKDVRHLFSNKILLLIWSIMIVGFTIIMSVDIKKPEDKDIMKVAVVNEDESNRYSSMLVNFFENNDNFAQMAQVFESDLIEATDMFSDGSLGAYIIIPKGFFDKMMETDSCQVKVRINEGYTTLAIILKNILRSYERYVTAIQYNTMGYYYKMRDAGVPREIAVTKDFTFTYGMAMGALDKESFFSYDIVKDYSAVSIKQYYIYAIIAIFIMYCTVYLGVDIMKEKSLGVIKRYRACDGNMMTYVCARIIGGFVFVGALIIIPLIAGGYIKDQSINFELVIMYSIIILFNVTLVTMLSMLINNFQTYILSTNMICMLSSILGGALIPAMYLPDNLMKIAKYMPVYGFINYTAAIYNGKDIMEYIKFIVALLVASLIMIVLSWLSARRCQADE